MASLRTGDGAFSTACWMISKSVEPSLKPHRLNMISSAPSAGLKNVFKPDAIVSANVARYPFCNVLSGL